MQPPAACFIEKAPLTTFDIAPKVEKGPIERHAIATCVYRDGLEKQAPARVARPISRAIPEIEGIMRLLNRIREKLAYSKKGNANEPGKKSSPARIRTIATIKLVSNVSFCMLLLTQASVAFGFLILPLLYSFRYVPEIYAGKTFSETSDSERGAPILLIVSLLLVLGIVLFQWLSAESEKDPGFHGAIPQQSK